MNENVPFLPLRSEVASRFRHLLPGKNLYDLAREHSVTIERSGKKNKGWAGQTLEKIVHLESGNLQIPDGLDFELKSTTLLKSPQGWKPKETIKVTQLKPDLLLEESFETSALWKKLQRLIVVGLEYPSPGICHVVNINCIDIREPNLVNEIRSFWEEVQHHLLSGEMPRSPNLGTSEDLIQLRPAGDGKGFSVCPVTREHFPLRAFYATKRLISKILLLL